MAGDPRTIRTTILISLGAALLPACRPAGPPPTPRAATTTIPASAPIAATSAVANSPAAANPPAPPLRGRVETIFESAVYYRPNLDTPNSSPASTTQDPPLKTQDSFLALPPLFAIRIPPGEARLPDHARIGRITVDDKGRVALNPARPAVYWAEDTILIHNRPHRQLWYVWFLAARAPEKTAADPADAEAVARSERHRLIITSARQSPLDAPLRNWQALRMTLSDDGFAMCTEVFQSEQIAKEYYIADSLEAAAAAAFGLPAPDRAFSIERSVVNPRPFTRNTGPDLADSNFKPPIPNSSTVEPRSRPESSASPLKTQDSGLTAFSVVARILADGPQPMGPWVYIDAADHAVTTLLCRCMPSQIKSIVENNTYDLLPFDALTALPAADPLPTAPLNLVGTHRFDAQPDALVRDLRLPPLIP